MTSTNIEADAASAHALRHGIWSINISMFAFVAGDTILKFLGRSFPPNELIFLRSAVITIALGTIILVSRRRWSFKAILSPPMLARCLFDCVNILAFTAAVIHMQMAELYAILLMSPFLMTILAVLFFREPVGYRRWLAIAGGFCGALLVVKPNPYALDQWALLGLLAAVAAAIRETVTRKIDRNTPTIDVTFYSALFAAAGTFVVGWREPWPSLTGPQSLMLAMQAASWLLGAWLLVHASRFAPLSIVAAFRYVLLIWGGLAGYFVFGDVPDLWSLLGAALIVACGLYTFHREAVRQRAIASDVVTLN